MTDTAVVGGRTRRAVGTAGFIDPSRVVWFLAALGLAALVLLPLLWIVASSFQSDQTNQSGEHQDDDHPRDEGWDAFHPICSFLPLFPIMWLLPAAGSGGMLCAWDALAGRRRLH